MSENKSNGAQMGSRSYRLPVADLDFLQRDELRGVRLMLEYEKAELVLRDLKIRSTIVGFGSARVPSPEDAAEMAAAAKTPEEHEAAERASRLSAYYGLAREFGRIASLRGGAMAAEDGWRDNVIATGGGGGMMEAVSRGAFDAGAPNIGFNITLPHEQAPNPYTTPELTFQFHYFAMRKMHLAIRANALAVFPGGYGTFDEAFEILTLRATGVSPPTPIVFVGRSYWTKAVNFEMLRDEGMISQRELDLFDFAETAEEAWACLVRRGLKTHPASEPQIALAL